MPKYDKLSYGDFKDDIFKRYSFKSTKSKTPISGELLIIYNDKVTKANIVKVDNDVVYFGDENDMSFTNLDNISVIKNKNILIISDEI